MDSQRIAFSLCVGLSDEDGLRRFIYYVAHPVTGRYMPKEKSTWDVEIQY